VEPRRHLGGLGVGDQGEGEPVVVVQEQQVGVEPPLVREPEVLPVERRRPLDVADVQVQVVEVDAL
jgi:hypothetical protein